MSALVLFALPLAVGALSLFVPSARTRVSVARCTAWVLVAVAVWLVRRTAGGEIVAVEFGGWIAPVGVSFLVDRLSSLFLVLLTLVVAATLSTLQVDGSERTVARLAPAVMFLTSALAGAFSTSDLFNLFVMFELVLVSSYLLLQASGEGARRELAPYVAINVVASLLFFIGAGALYAVGGALDVNTLASVLPAVDSAWKTTGLALLALAFATKAGLVPLMFWLPRTYRHLFGPIAALFAGMLTKLGVYALIRITPLMRDTPVPEALLWLGALSAVAGVLAAQAQTRFRELLCFHIVSQVGFMVAGVGLASLAGIAGAILYVAHHVLVKTALFLVADVADPVDDVAVAPRRRRTSRLLPLTFLLAGLSLAGMPPLSGFLGKVAVFQALLESPRPAVLGLLLVSSLFTLVSVLKMWRMGFVDASAARDRPVPLGAVILVAASIVLAVAAGPVERFATDAADQIGGGGTSARQIATVGGDR